MPATMATPTCSASASTVPPGISPPRCERAACDLGRDAGSACADDRALALLRPPTAGSGRPPMLPPECRGPLCTWRPSALRPGGGTPHPVAPPPDDAGRDHGDRQCRLDLAGPDEVAGIGEVEPVIGTNPDHAGLDLLLNMLQPQEHLGRGCLSGAGATGGVCPQHAEPDDDRHREHGRGEMPEELHRDRPGRQAAKRRATPTIHRQSSAAWMGTRISVSVAVVPCICRQKELAGGVIPSCGSATSDIRMPDAMHSVMDSSSSRLTSQTNRSRPPGRSSLRVVRITQSQCSVRWTSKTTPSPMPSHSCVAIPVNPRL